MTVLYLDLETFNEVDIAVGTHRYAETAEILIWAFAIDDAPARAWDVTTGEPMPDDLAAALADPSVMLVAHNWLFDRTVLQHRGYRTDRQRWRCTMALALAHSLPGGLDKLCALFGLSEEQSKIADGRRLVLKFCKPQGRTAKVRRRTRETDPEDWQRFIDYAVRDVEAMRTLMKRMPRYNWTPAEVERFHIDGAVNERGFAVDLDLAKAALAAADAEQIRLAEQAQELTLGVVESTTQRDALLDFLREECDLHLPDLRASTVEEALERSDLDPFVAELLRTRLQASTVSVKKYAAVARAVSSDGRLRGTQQFRGAARTGRVAGRTFQPHNLPRPPRHLGKADIAAGIEAIKAGAIDLVSGNVMEMLSAALRGLIVAAPGRKLVVSDLANIEGRLVAWLALEEWKLQAFRDFDAGVGPDLYKVSYGRAFGIATGAVEPDQRQVGKVMELSFSYQGAVGAFNTMGAAYGVALPKNRVLEIVSAWRAAHPRVVELWRDLDNAVCEVTRSPNIVKRAGRLVVDAVKRGETLWVRIELPSGRFLCYPQPEVDTDGRWSYMGINQYTRKWERIQSYGGKCLENATQAAAADVLLHGMALAEEHDYPVVLSVHDELVTEPLDDPRFDVHGLAKLMTTNPPWATGLPLAAEGFETYRYRK